jgi:glycosyltransferase involved in cell wall biosynthesis
MPKNFIGKNAVKRGKNFYDNNMKMMDTGNIIQIEMQKSYIDNTNIHDITESVRKLLSVKKIQQSVESEDHAIGETKDKGLLKPVAFFLDGRTHYTGGRYFFYSVAVMLSRFYPVTVYTTEKPPFYDDFKSLYSENFNMVYSENFNFESVVHEFYNLHDTVVISPIKSGDIAIKYKEMKESVNVISFIYESPNYVAEFREGIDSQESFWNSYKRALLISDKIVTISETSKEYIAKWLPDYSANNIVVFYPFLNFSQNFENIVGSKKCEKKHLVFPSRVTDFKNPLSIFKSLDRAKYKLSIIGNVNSANRRKIESMQKNGYEIEVHTNASDTEKYEIMKSCDAFLYPSKFEGFGMGALEAGILNKPIFAYKIPVLFEVYGQGIFYMVEGKESGYIDSILSNDNAVYLKSKSLNERATEISNPERVVKDIFTVFDIPKITAGMTVYNCQEYVLYAIRSIYNNVKKIVVIDGCVKGYNDRLKNGKSDDGTLHKLYKFKKEYDVLNKIIIVELPDKKFWKSKMEQQNEILKHVDSPKYYIKIDSDEIWCYKTLQRAIRFLEENEDISILKMLFIHFWTSFNIIAKDAGGKWSTAHPRIWRYKEGFVHKRSFNFFQIKKPDSNLYEKVESPKYASQVFNGLVYHFGYCRPLSKVTKKLNYYKNRGIEKVVINTYKMWKGENDPTQPTQVLNSWAEKFTGKLPDVLKRHKYVKLKDVRNEKG